MEVYRICKDRYAKSLDGEGAFRNGGRWNSKGTRVLYTSGSIALATLEVLVHTDGVPIKKGMSIIKLSFPTDSICENIELPKGWNHKPAKQATKEIGDAHMKSKKWLAIKVPSIVIEEEFNYLLNPLHERFNEVKIISIKPFNFDSRL